MKWWLIFSFLLISGYSGWAATFTVTNNNDSGPGSFRQALFDAGANGIASSDRILFNIPSVLAEQVTIRILSALPAVSSNLSIDGGSQTSSLLGNDRIRVHVTNNSSDYFHGLAIENISDVDINGLYFSNFLSLPGASISAKKSAIYLRNCGNIQIRNNGFGGNTVGILSPFDLIANQFVQDLSITSNIIGLSANGMNAAPNEVGVDLSFLRNTTIGGNVPEDGNLLSANTIAGLACAAIEGSLVIANNQIGFNLNKTRTFSNNNASGMNIYSNRSNSDVIISSNLIVSQKTAIYLEGVNNGYRLINNDIGTASSANVNGNNQIGLHITGCQGEVGIVGGGDLSMQNRISYNTQAILIERSYPVSILKNSIFCNNESIVFKENPAGKIVTQSSIDQLTTQSARGKYLPNSIIELFYDDECPDCQGKTWIASIPTAADGSWEYSSAIPFAGGVTSTGTNTDGATSSFSKPIILDQNNEIQGTFCNAGGGSITNITVSDASVYTWYTASGQRVANGPELLDMPSGDYYLIAGQPGACEIRSTLYTIPNTNLNYIVKASTIKPASCGVANGSITITAYETAFPILFEWTDASGAVVGTDPFLTNLKPGTYRLSASNGNGCSNLAGTFEVEETEPFVIDLTNLAAGSSCDGKLVTVSGIEVIGSTGPYSYEWFNENNQRVGSELTLQGVEPGNYQLQISDRDNCIQRSELLNFTEAATGLLAIPNSFSPNGDRINDTWVIKGAANYPGGRFAVYNRFGNLVYSSVGYQNIFDGTYKGDPLPEGVYYYFIDLNNDCERLSGSITILR